MCVCVWWGGDLEEYVSYNKYLKHKLHDENINSEDSANVLKLLAHIPSKFDRFSRNFL